MRFVRLPSLGLALLGLRFRIVIDIHPRNSGRNRFRHIGYLWRQIGGEAAAFRLNRGDAYDALRTGQLVRDTTFQRGADFHAIVKRPRS